MLFRSVTVKDLLFHLPFRYQDKTRITPIAHVKPGEFVVVAGEVSKVEVRYKKKRILYCYINDKSGLLCLRFFYFNELNLPCWDKWALGFHLPVMVHFLQKEYIQDGLFLSPKNYF